MDAIAEFFGMGGYALYVWGSYGMAFALLGLEVLWLARRSRRRLRPVEQRRPVRPKWERVT